MDMINNNFNNLCIIEKDTDADISIQNITKTLLKRLATHICINVSKK